MNTARISNFACDAVRGAKSQVLSAKDQVTTLVTDIKASPEAKRTLKAAAAGFGLGLCTMLLALRA